MKIGVTSYYQHSQGGKGKYIEKKLASSFETCSLGIEISKLPMWLEHPSLYRKKGIFTQQGLSPEERRIFRTTDWDWIGTKDVSVDVGSIIKDEDALVLVEIKNRVDTGGTAGRREVWTSEKFGAFVECLMSNKKVFRKQGKEFSFVELLENFGIKILELYLGVLFDKTENPATIETDRLHGFYSSNKEGLNYLKNLTQQSSTINIIREDSKTFQMELGLTYSNLKIKIGVLYGDDVTLRLFRKNLPVSNLLLLRYDDIWLSQLITIEERAMLLKHQKNFTTTFLDLLKRDRDLRIKYDAIIDSECGESELNAIVNYLFDKYTPIFENKILPDRKDKVEYLAYVVQVLCACES